MHTNVVRLCSVVLVAALGCSNVGDDSAERRNHCTPTTCALQYATCGTIGDGCGGTLSCGSCPAPYTCGGGGIANQCGCVPAACQVGQCGSIADGCGGTLDC